MGEGGETEILAWYLYLWIKSNFSDQFQICALWNKVLGRVHIGTDNACVRCGKQIKKKDEGPTPVEEINPLRPNGTICSRNVKISYLR